MLREESVDVLNAKTIEVPTIQSTPSFVPLYYTATDGATITVIAVPNAFAFIDVNNNVSSLSFNVSADVSALSFGDKVLICFRYSSLNASNVATATVLSPIKSSGPNFTIRNTDDNDDPMARYLLDLTFNGTSLLWTFEVC